jgi:hypothetical protein
VSVEQATRRILRPPLGTVRRWLTLSLAVTLALALSAAALAAGTSLHVHPHKVQAGHRVHISGSADGCPVGDRVTLLSKAFSHRHEFAGVPAVFTRVKSGGHFGRWVRIPARRAARRYSIGGRCGGGNLGVTRHLRVVRPD